MRRQHWAKSDPRYHRQRQADWLVCCQSSVADGHRLDCEHNPTPREPYLKVMS